MYRDLPCSVESGSCSQVHEYISICKETIRTHFFTSIIRDIFVHISELGTAWITYSCSTIRIRFNFVFRMYESIASNICVQNSSSSDVEFAITAIVSLKTFMIEVRKALSCEIYRVDRTNYSSLRY